MADPEGEILTLEEVATYLKAGKRTVYRLAHERKIPTFKLGGGWRFCRAACIFSPDIAKTYVERMAIDYDVTAQATKRFFAIVQNKLHWAIHGQTAAEVIYYRADADQPNMGLITWKDAPLGKFQKFDVAVAKNYLTEQEMAQRKIPMTMQDWETRLNRFIEATDREVLQDAGKVTAEIAKAHAESEFEKYRIVQDRLFESDFDRLLKQIESENNQGKGDA
jgi:excisionase family DNA binding protein